jgi:V/A-type H+-transporting ATPase subunit E
MGLEKIKEEILQKAAATEKGILLEATAKAEAIRNKASEQVKQLESEAAKKLQSELKSLESKETSLANMESQKLFFEAKKEAMDNVYQESLNKIRNMPAKDRKETIEKLIAMAKKEIDVDLVFDKKFCEGNVKDLQTNGGIICETKDNSVRVNLTFDNLFTDLREKTSKEVSKILFK